MGFLFVAAVLLTGALAGQLARGRLGASLSGVFAAVSPVTLTPLSVLYGFLIGFLALHVWGDWDRAHQVVGAEASALRETVVLTEVIDRRLGADVAGDIRAYVSRAPAEWEAMAEGREQLGEPPRELLSAMHRLVAYEAGRGPAALPADKALAAMDRAMDARRQRVLISQHGGVALPSWIAALTLAVCLQLSIAIVHAHQPKALVLTLAIFSIAAATSMAVVAAHDHPYRKWPPGAGYGALQQSVLLQPAAG